MIKSPKIQAQVILPKAGWLVKIRDAEQTRLGLVIRRQNVNGGKAISW